MAQLPDIRVRAKMVFVVAHIDDHGKEETQSTVRYDITDVLTESEWNDMITQFKTGKLIPEVT